MNSQLPESSVGESAKTGPVAKSQVAVALTATFLIYLGMMSINPIIAPLSRELGFDEWQVGLMVSTAAFIMVLTSQFWGKRSLSLGRRPVLLVAMLLGAIAMSLFALGAWLGMAGVLTGVTLFITLLVTRGVMFGLAIAAVPATVQALIASITTTEQERVKGMAGFGAVQGSSMIGGAVVGGFLGALGILVPLAVVPVIVFIGFILVFFFIAKDNKTELVKSPKSVSPFDARIWPFLVAGIAIMSALGFMQIVTGFIIQDRYHLSAEASATLTGATLVTAGIAMLISQTLIVPKAGWSPSQLLKVGSVVALLGFVGMVFDLGLFGLISAIALVGLGLGLAIPGFNAGASLQVDQSEQGGVAGVMSAGISLTFAISPLAATTLYGIWPELPLLVSVFMIGVAVIFVYSLPQFRKRPRAIAAVDE